MKKYSILIADDDPDDQFLIQTAFEEINTHCSIDFVHDGEQLQNKLKDLSKVGKLPHLLLMDLNMPKIDGRSLLVWLKKNKDFRHIPALILSTSGAEEEVKNAYANGAAAYVVKPAEYNALLAFLENLTRFYFGSATLSSY
ncbi:response regulator [Marinilongibacter aquaticus]|uniref:response regulator n=1 Tax=Marinilongibacter aquaticus TaxID=2975157 RepID=UPI0021BD7606|nr:response regulator [Marinilongibacter aquaticus]UBM60656.1 response regulator [Marinilongibacter aquaticus]